jgi:hypothetical protein
MIRSSANLWMRLKMLLWMRLKMLLLLLERSGEGTAEDAAGFSSLQGTPNKNQGFDWDMKEQVMVWVELGSVWVEGGVHNFFIY